MLVPRCYLKHGNCWHEFSTPERCIAYSILPRSGCAAKPLNQAREDWISKFEKPKTSPNSIDPSTTVLSMYISHGCLSTRRFWHALCEVYTKRGGSRPPVSLKVTRKRPEQERPALSIASKIQGRKAFFLGSVYSKLKRLDELKAVSNDWHAKIVGFSCWHLQNLLVETVLFGTRVAP